MKRTASQVLLTTCLLLFSLCAQAADESDTAETTLGGTIPELCQIAITNYGTCTNLLDLTVDVNAEGQYDQGYVTSLGNATVMWCDSNKSAQVSVRRSADWSCPGAYDKDETDLLMRVSNATGGGSIQNSFNSYQNPTTENQVFYQYGSNAANAAIAIQYRVQLDWTSDIPGAYSITLVYTLETTTP